MPRVLRWIAVLVVVAFVAASFGLTGCAKHPSPEQLKALDEAKAAALAAEKQKADKETERDDLMKQLQAKKQELEKARQEKAKVQENLQKMGS